MLLVDLTSGNNYVLVNDGTVTSLGVNANLQNIVLKLADGSTVSLASEFNLNGVANVAVNNGISLSLGKRDAASIILASDINTGKRYIIDSTSASLTWTSVAATANLSTTFYTTNSGVTIVLAQSVAHNYYTN
eukprot:TRINITY_DN8858_c0_g1_i1.p2 TRINITY_DN8858_c0_g1~~TRINITY_DN8858_c0_g1_i1.p2  ORF type:complete len:133 (+),score=35.04 TRINITY_DN8858_c0_g1_i1:530-928(+)